MKELAKNYQPHDFEDRLYKFWLDKDYFRANINKDKKPFTIVMPPPNVTGQLHIGHAINNTIQDILIRYKRMKGFEALWIPGTDHASISTEAKVVEKLKSEGKTKQDIGREEFLKESWDWTHKYGGIINDQLKKLGVSCDWSRQSFTLDDKLSKAVGEVFIRLYKKGLIYRGDRIINWCPNCKTAVSDAEVDHHDHDGFIWYFKYPLKEGDGFIEIATTRPETIPGDLAVAVNPKDERYKDLVGKKLIIPIINREIPIIQDEYVEMKFGSGAVKITPSHDPNDFEVGARHELGQLKVIDDDGRLNDLAGKYAGMDRKEARKAIIKDFKDAGFFVKEEKHKNAVGHCSRCNETIEPLLSKQWFVKMEPLAKPALEAYKNKELKFIPERFGKIYTHWLDDIKDWCISRQLWWGHRLPVYYCNETGETVVDLENPEGRPGYEGKTFTQDPDTLDTWFSSALWPFSTLGWPEKTPDFEYFYPTDVLVTGYDIIFFWVVRMVFSALEQTGEVPFKDVLLNGLVRDAEGRKMSKSLGNGIDPLKIIDEYGADALRFTLVTGNSAGNDTRFSKEKVEASRNFANKLWNATRFLMMHIGSEDLDIKLENLEDEDKWILTKLQSTIDNMTERLDVYDLGSAANEIYDFTWSQFCDWYIEMVKPRLFGDDIDSKNAAKASLIYVLKAIIRLLHPYMPFITEEIWQHIFADEQSIMISSWPESKKELVFETESYAVEYIQEAIRKIRNLRSEMNIEAGRKSKVLIATSDERIKSIYISNELQLKNLGFANSIEFVEKAQISPENNVNIVLDKSEIFLPLRDLIDFEKEKERLKKEEEKTQAEIKRAKGKLSNKSFTDKAPKEIVDSEREKLAKYEEMLITIRSNIEKLK
ncbi:valine--tRNA ligase [Peptoniphilus sp. GNH]|nr:valine--tRNA ligase [Clostridiales bacterium KA00134]UHR03196.1 valine--tRNA ligase [Peptoniphilus sp. GNH]